MKKIFEKYVAIVASSVLLFSCAQLDDEIDTGLYFEKPVSLIIKEKVSSYEVLQAYSGDLILGADETLVNAAGPMTSLLKTNFNQVTPSTELYSEIILSNDGIYDFTAINDYVRKAEENGLSVYGDAIISNTNQNDRYLNTLAAPFTYYTPLFPNKINPDPLYDGTFIGWGASSNLSVQDYLGEPSLEIINDASAGNSNATFLQSPVYSVEEGANFEMTFYLLSKQRGEGRVVFTGLNNNEPELDWMRKGLKTATFNTKIGWNEIKFQTDDFDGSGQFSFKIELGHTANVTYYLNIQGISVINLNGSVYNPDEIFLECENAQQQGAWMISKTDDPANVSNGGMLVGIIDGDIAADDGRGGNPSDANNQDLQFTYTFNVRTAGVYKLWLRQKSHKADNGYDSYFISVDGAEYYCPGWPAWGAEANTTTWTWMKLYTDSNDKDGSSLFDFSAGEHTISIRIREGGHYFDKMYLTMTINVPTGFGSAVISQEEVTLDISDVEKQTAVNGFMNEYISAVLEAKNEKIDIWTVVKNPFSEDGSVAVSNGSSAAGTFYWADYLGSDYIVQAFSIAKANASTETRLFIAETDLNTNADKLNAVIAAVNSIVEIDGIAVSLNLNLDSDMDKVANMLEKLSTTGKMVYITNLAVSIPESTEEAYALQSGIYKSVVELYKTKVPASQEYGISLATPVGNMLGLWDTDYNRKQTYVGFSVGLGAQE